ncbi:copper chaperone PCu(A)C [Sphingomonas sp. TX0543]|uniref:copper chaperone PCu(A)C n=1 Tax=unclassified Sphingomonas TaxID=196159 RepID=UPI0010F967E3|nr:copper chaperone PCu(A)C [Sphingomonas sp. 3P27F8]
MRTFATFLLAAAALGGCSQQKQLSVSNAWVRLPAVTGRPAAAYFTIHGGAADATLINISTDVAVRTEMHEMKAGANGAMTMDAIQQVRVPARQTVRFAPGGQHAMLFDVNPSVKPGGQIAFTFTFADGLRIQQQADVVGAGDPPPKG